MNIKLHTPKSLKAGSGMASLKQFLLSLFATSVSIALTFGTAAIIEYKSKQNAKREIVMMVMYDMYNSLESIENNDSVIIRAMDAQLKLAEDTTRFAELWDAFLMSIPSVDFTETTERIFSSSIERSTRWAMCSSQRMWQSSTRIAKSTRPWYATRFIII
jgi:ABC-type dipeptide/oligopeptide/nickel transport system ATPase subunit